MAAWLKGQKEKELQRFLLECVLFQNLDRHWTDKGKADPLFETAARYGVDPKKIEAEFRAEVKEKKAEKKGKKRKSLSVKQKAKRADPPKARTIPMKDLCKLHGTVKKKGEPKPGVCRECGCTETTPCEGGCAWTDKTKTLCTACKMAKEHRWEKQNLVMIASKGGIPMHDIYKCKKCGATGKRFGISEFIRPDKPFTELKCPGPKKEVQTSAKEKVTEDVVMAI
jgi:hypothetical protein